MTAGMDYASGDAVVFMDADLQDPPHLLPEMLNDLRSGEYDCIGSRRVTRKGEPKIRSFFARQFYKIINKLSNIEIVDGARDFQMMKRFRHLHTDWVRTSGNHTSMMFQVQNTGTLQR